MAAPTRAAYAALLTVPLLLLLLAPPASAHDRYEVAEGDTLSGIAVRFGVRASALADENDLHDPDLVVVGTTLVIPAGGGAGGGGGGGGSRTHAVAPGETLSHIAARYGVSTASLAEANGLTNPNLVVSGSRLRLPGGAGSGATAGSSSSAGGGRPTGGSAVGALLADAAARYGWNARTIQALAHVESGWNNAVVSVDGAIGIMQVLPATADWVGPGLLGREVDLRDPEDNVETGVALLDHLYDRVGGDIRLALGAYYQGLRGVQQHGLYAETEHYVDTVLAARNRF